MHERQRVPAGTIWDEKFGYSRAVRVGDVIHVSGTAATREAPDLDGADEMYAQAVSCLRIIKEALSELGAGMKDVVRTRIYVTDIERWQAVARAHAEHFAGVKPATTLVEVARLIEPDMLVEIEAEAVV